MSMEQLVDWELAGETCPSVTLFTINPTWHDLGSNPGRRGRKPAPELWGGLRTELFVIMVQTLFSPEINVSTSVTSPVLWHRVEPVRLPALHSAKTHGLTTQKQNSYNSMYACFSIPKPCIFPLRMALKINSEYILKQYSLTDLSNGDAVFSLRKELTF
jgi:hypothetical protein